MKTKQVNFDKQIEHIEDEKKAIRDSCILNEPMEVMADREVKELAESLQDMNRWVRVQVK